MFSASIYLLLEKGNDTVAWFKADGRVKVHWDWLVHSRTQHENCGDFGIIISVFPGHCKQLEMPVYVLCHYPGIPISHHYLQIDQTRRYSYQFHSDSLLRALIYVCKHA